MRSGFYEDARYCSTCETYVRYLLAVDVAYCATCGAVVSLYAERDLRRVLDTGSRGRGAERRAEDDRARAREPRRIGHIDRA